MATYVIKKDGAEFKATQVRAQQSGGGAGSAEGVAVGAVAGWQRADASLQHVGTTTACRWGAGAAATRASAGGARAGGSPIALTKNTPFFPRSTKAPTPPPRPPRSLSWSLN
jgi:hypothetical protein